MWRSFRYLHFLSIILVVTASLEKDSSYYGGVYQGTCGDNGIYYKDSKGFMVCSNKYGYYMQCPTGTRNPPKSFFTAGKFYSNTDFCGVMVDIFGHSRSDFLKDAEEDLRPVAVPLVRKGAGDGHKSAQLNWGESQHVSHSEYTVPNHIESRHTMEYSTPLERSVQESPRVFMRKVLDVANESKRNESPWHHHSSYETRFSETEEAKSRSPYLHGSRGSQNSHRSHDSYGLHVTQNGQPLHGGHNPSPLEVHDHARNLAKTGLQSLFRKSNYASETGHRGNVPVGKSVRVNKDSKSGVVKTTTTHTYHDPRGLVKTYQHTMYAPESHSERDTDSISKELPAPPPLVAPPTGNYHIYPLYKQVSSGGQNHYSLYPHSYMGLFPGEYLHADYFGRSAPEHHHISSAALPSHHHVFIPTVHVPRVPEYKPLTPSSLSTPHHPNLKVHDVAHNPALDLANHVLLGHQPYGIHAQHSTFLPPEGRQALMPLPEGQIPEIGPMSQPLPPVPILQEPLAHDLPKTHQHPDEKSFTFKEESYSVNSNTNDMTDGNRATVPGTRNFMSKKSEYVNINGKTLKDYSTMVYGTEAI